MNIPDGIPVLDPSKPDLAKIVKPQNGWMLVRARGPSGRKLQGSGDPTKEQALILDAVKDKGDLDWRVDVIAAADTYYNSNVNEWFPLPYKAGDVVTVVGQIVQHPHKGWADEGYGLVNWEYVVAVIEEGEPSEAPSQPVIVT
mgnify:CR=1 FL=1